MRAVCCLNPDGRMYAVRRWPEIHLIGAAFKLAPDVDDGIGQPGGGDEARFPPRCQYVRSAELAMRAVRPTTNLVPQRGAWAGPALGAIAVSVCAFIIVAATMGRIPDPSLPLLAGVAGVLMVASQVQSRWHANALLAESRKRWFASATRGLVELDADLRIIETNHQLASLLSTDEQNMVGASLAKYFSGEAMARMSQKFQALRLGSKSTVEADSPFQRADGSTEWLHWRARLVRKPDGNFDHFLTTFEDFTPNHAAEATAIASLAELEKLNQLKTEFTSMVSHEFRTALTGIQGMSELISIGNLEAGEVREYGTFIFNEAQRVNRLITDMLDLDRFEAGKMKLRLGPVDLNHVIDRAIQGMRAGNSKHVITANMDSSVPVVVADPDRFFQVITNLLSNAIKYSPDGGEIVVASCIRGGDVLVSVKDHGVGLPADFADRLFGRFERYENNPSKVIGAGLGLAIARQIVEMHGGKIWVESREGAGSEFCFTVPARSAGPAPSVSGNSAKPHRLRVRAPGQIAQARCRDARSPDAGGQMVSTWSRR